MEKFSFSKNCYYIGLIVMSTTVPEAAASRTVVPVDVERLPAMVTVTSTKEDRERGAGVDLEIEVELEDLIDVGETGKGKIPGIKEVAEAMMDMLGDFFEDADDDDVGGGGGDGDSGGDVGSDDDVVDVDAPVYGDITVTCSC